MSDDEIDPQIEDELLAQLKAQASQERKHASFFSWHDRSSEGRGIAEAGIVTDLLGAMEAEGHRNYRSLGPSDEEWPDVWLQDTDGRRVPCEVTELVDVMALPAGQARSWTAAVLVDVLQATIRKKGLRSLGGGAGIKSVLVIHTDEDHLNVDNTREMLDNARFVSLPTIARVFLLFSYDPARGGYRYLELQLSNV